MFQVKRDPTTNQSRGYGFIRFRDYDAQVMCLAERHFIDSRWCDVRIPMSKVSKTYFVRSSVVGILVYIIWSKAALYWFESLFQYAISINLFR